MGQVPNVITQALWCLKTRKQSAPIDVSRIVIITTLSGKGILEKGNPKTGLQSFTGKNDVFNKYCQEFNTFPSLLDKDIHVICDENGNELPDIRTSKHFECTSNSIINVLRELTSHPDNVLHCIYSGGRRAMAVYLGLALTLLGRKQDHFYYVRLSPRSAMVPSFFYPQKNDNLELSLQEIPFARLGEKYANILTSDDSYLNLVGKIQDQVDLAKPAIVRMGEQQINIVGNNPVFKKMLSDIDLIAKQDGAKILLLYGESGTGKEIIARYFHRNSNRSKKPFFSVNCAAVPDNLIESELFGHEKGAFTGAYKDKQGVFEEANEGTVFLDEINSTPPFFQAKLLRLLDSGEIQKVGSVKTKKVNVRFIIALNELPSDLVNKGSLRNDFYQRINTFEYTIPPLRHRSEDIPDLIHLFIDEFSTKYNKRIKKISHELLDKFRTHSWKEGNVRALKSIIERMVLFADDEEVSLTSLPNNFEVEGVQLPEDSFSTANQNNIDYNKLLTLPHNEFQKVYFEHQMGMHKGNISSAADSLGIPRTTLQSKLDELGVDPNKFR
ncbi:MAG: TIGR02584 family CRISPR-associated protein [Bacteroidales bacterium]|nr:TIGR02584 family CRISPR-associated protein [Bacteroidales bacterium]